VADRRVVTDLIVNDRGSKAFDKVADGAGRAEGKLKKFGATAKAGIAGAAVGAAVGIGALGKQLFDAAVGVEAMGNKAKVVFGKQFDRMQATTSDFTEKLGLTKNEVLGMEAGFGDLLIPMGFTQSNAADMSYEFTRMTGVLAQWSGGTKSAADVQDILGDALTGEYDSLKSLGVQIDADRVKTLLHAAGKDKLTGSARKQAEAELVLKEITRQSSSAVDSYAKGTNKLGLAKNRLSSKLKQVKEDLAAKLIPAFAKAAGWVADRLIPAVSRLAAWLGPRLRPIVAAVRSAFTSFTGALRGNGQTAVQLREIAGKLREAWQHIQPVVAVLARVYFAQLRTVFRAIGAVLRGVVIPAVSAGLSIFNRLARAVESAVNRIRTAWSKIPKFSLPSVDVPFFASGGEMRRPGLAVVGERGPELVALPGGSRVFSNSDSKAMVGGGRAVGGGGDTHIHVHVARGFIGSPRELAAALRQITVDAGARGFA
jgi:hypothetical protein